MIEKTKKYKNDAMAAIHETATGLFETGVIDKKTMRDFDTTCLTPIKPLSARQIKAIRTKEQVSQNVFANYLNVTVGLISQWERGEKHPAGPSLKLLSIVAQKGLSAIL
jgi:putative transcriptional regulator